MNRVRPADAVPLNLLLATEAGQRLAQMGAEAEDNAGGAGHQTKVETSSIMRSEKGRDKY